MILYRCMSCGQLIESDKLIYRCPDCGPGPSSGFQRGNLLVESLPGKIYKKGEIINPLELLPLDCRKALEAFPAGNTPFLKPRALRKNFPQLQVKLEGANPSGSLKDRASLLIAVQAEELGVNKIVLASTGNAGSAMSCAGAALGLEVILFVPASAPPEKLIQSLYYGARVIPVDGTYDDAFRLSMEYSGEFGGINRNTAYHPLTTEGKKTCALEIYNQYGGKVPDLVYIPTGDGVIYTGLCKGFSDLYRLGLIDHLPRCILVQAKGSDALVRSFREGKDIILERTNTLADSIGVCSPAAGEAALHFLKKTEAWAIDVSDTEILQAQKELAQKAGLFVEPSSASVWAALLRDREEGRISGEESIVLLLTGTGFKDIGVIREQIKIPPATDCTLKGAVDYLEKHYEKRS